MQQDALWSCFQHNSRNTGRSPYISVYQHDHPWMFQTGKGIFSTPVIDNEVTIYAGSANHRFYALLPDGSLKWSIGTGELFRTCSPRFCHIVHPSLRETRSMA